MTHQTHTDAVRADFEQMRTDFEKCFGPMPWGCTWNGCSFCPTEFNAWQAQEYMHKFDGFKAARRAPVVPQGWKLVPEKPTSAMLCALMQWDGETGLTILPEYKAMLAAAPQPPQAQRAEGD